ncbi:sugar transferase [Pseudoroseicyclus sp. CLL3-39]|uniref:Sugar transferase n=1 Tax=Pseudoroseicyclus tamaricis TaxID=2705421 RepID=A0A6B2JP38_9RHOB|nr:sugar transferase [Pseudoroseicyclus tamaricis]
MTPAKRALDVTGALILSLTLWPVVLLFMLILLIVEGRPVFFISERMRTPTQSFKLIKLRSMQVDMSAEGVTGGDKAVRISRLQRFVRRVRIDELPQLWNVLRGDISLVGPRPPLRKYVESFPEIYGEVLKSRPGITGLATIVYYPTEEKLLAACDTPIASDTTYRSRCIPRKARLDLIYQKNRTIGLDLWLIARTAMTPFRRKG